MTSPSSSTGCRPLGRLVTYYVFTHELLVQVKEIG